MSDQKDPDETETFDQTAEDNLDELDGDGFDRVVAEARVRAATGGVLPEQHDEDGESDEPDPTFGDRPFTAEEAGLRTTSKGWGRSPIVSIVVIVVGVFLLAATWGDFRYFLRSAQSGPRDIGRVRDIYANGEFTERFDNEWVVLEGDPDVQHAARMPGREGWIGFMRLNEADASLFVAVPRATEKANNEFPGRFEGRMRRMSAVPQWDRLEVFFNAEEISDTIELSPASLAAALRSGGNEVEGVEGGTSTLIASDRLGITVPQPTGVVQLGRTTWASREAADTMMKAFGRPFVFVEKRDMVWVYALDLGVAPGTEPKLELFQELTRALNGGEDLASADPMVGGLVLPRRATYRVSWADLQSDGETLSFTYAENTAGTGFAVRDGVLAPVELDHGRLSVPVAAIAEAWIDRPLRANPDGYLVMVDQRPTDVWPSAVMFIAVFGVVGLNAWALIATLRRRRAAAA